MRYHGLERTGNYEVGGLAPDRYAPSMRACNEQDALQLPCLSV